MNLIENLNLIDDLLGQPEAEISLFKAFTDAARDDVKLVFTLALIGKLVEKHKLCTRTDDLKTP